ncbi:MULTISPECIES: site-2 protease family protein [Caproicibacterium]|uniref:Site-2 protease family protein n=1 Tax=Caproicibacterium argilliputei TaxID=3030016 RepID=A0AA97D5P5_9FIRM|nr:site-2 protease family protein [Caproicibacterium argilliputei]WOC31055.1 site-2 protease family protein [Caproicibacterium argilliputei]
MLYTVLQSITRGEGINMASLIAQILASVLIIFLILPFHELAHGWVAGKLGDPTAKYSGRLTFNPLASVDLFGTVSLLLFGIGWAKPVPVNPRYFKKPKRDMAITALAGPVANLLASFVSAVLLNLVVVLSGGSVLAGTYVPSTVVTFLIAFFGACTTINISLAAFNLLPIPPLDGSRILAMFLSDRAMEAYYRYQNIVMYVLFALLLVGVLDVPLAILQNLFTSGVQFLANLPFYALGV